MEEWKEYKLGEIADIQTGPFGSQLHQRDYVPVGTPCIMPTNIGNRLNIETTNIAHVKDEDIVRLQRHCVKEGDIIYSRRGDIEKCAYILSANEGWLCGTGCLRLRINNKDVNSRFVAYQLSTNECKKWIVGNAVGSTMLNLNTSILKELPLHLPSKDEQDRYVKILKSLDDKIELNRRINDNLYNTFFVVVLMWLLTSRRNDNLEQQAQALFKSWFVDFEPFRDQPFVESELGMIPNGWRVGTLNELGDIVGGSTPSKAKPEYYTNDGIAWLTPKDLSIYQRKFTSKGEIDITQEGYESCSTKLMPKGSVLFSSRAPIGYITIAKNDICTNQGFKSVIPKLAGTAFLYCFLKESTQEIENKATGSTFKEASGALMKSLPALIPEKAVLDDFENLLSPLFYQQEIVEEENSLLSSLRDTLLPRLMSGEIKVEDVAF